MRKIDLKKRLRNEKRIIDRMGIARPEYKALPFPFDYADACRRGVFISACPQMGKTNLAKWITNYIMSRGDVCKVFDCSKAWLDSSIPVYQGIDNWGESHQEIFNPLTFSIIYDISKIYPTWIPDFVSLVIAQDFDVITHLPEPLPYTIQYIIEECQLCVPSGSLRAKKYQEVLRMVSVGGNRAFKMRYIGITQRPADVSVKLISRTGQLYLGRAWEENDLRKLKNYTNWKKKEAWDNFSDLRLGEFYYVKAGNIQKIGTPEFKTKIKPRLLEWRQPNWLEKLFGVR